MNPDELYDLDEAFQTAPEPEEFTEIPDGTYQAQIVGLDFFRGQTGTRFMKWRFMVGSGVHKGKTIAKLVSLKNDKDRMEWVKKEIRAAGINVDKLSEIPPIINDILGSWIELQAKTKEGGDGVPYQNFYINKPVQPLDLDPFEGAPF